MSTPQPIWKQRLYAQFPKASRVGACASRVRLTLLNLGIETEQVLFANALCRDELNTPTVNRFGNDWGENFSLAGLGGYPSAGRTGAQAYAAHLPENGTLLILFGPHIGITSEGEFGMAERPGQRGLTSACGALYAFQDKFNADPHYHPSKDPMDVEQSSLERAMLREYHEDKELSLIDAAYGAVKRAMRELFPASAYPRQVLIGGVLVNTPQGYEDYFEVRSATINRDGEVNDLLTSVTP